MWQCLEHADDEYGGYWCECTYSGDPQENGKKPCVLCGHVHGFYLNGNVPGGQVSLRFQPSLPPEKS